MMVQVLDEGHCYICGKSPCVIWVGQRDGALHPWRADRIGFCSKECHEQWEKLPYKEKWRRNPV